MATTMIKKLKLEDSSGQYTEVPVGQVTPEIAACFNISDKNNLELTATKSLNLEPTKHVRLKPGQGAQVELIADHTGDLDEVVVKVLTSVQETEGVITDLEDDKPIRLKVNASELELNAEDTDSDTYDVKFKTGKKATEGNVYSETKLKGKSFDVRCYEHGGISLQPCGADSNNFENKIKFETSRKTDLDATADYSTEGGKGIEIFTMNSQHMSAWSKDYRFRGDSPIYAVTRGTITQTGETGDEKYDYPTQSDDFKDIIDDTDPITWYDLIKAVKYLKSNGFIN